MKLLQDELRLPEEPTEIRAAVLAQLVDSLQEGRDTIWEGSFIADPLWKDWGELLLDSGMTYERFLRVVRGYSMELWLWIVGEHTWEHCISGLAGRTLRRLPQTRAAKRHDQELEPALYATSVSSCEA